MHTLETPSTYATPQMNGTDRSDLPMVTILTPAYNEEELIVRNLKRIYEYMEAREDRYRWEILVVNDGSKDQTAELADAFSIKHPKMRVIHHVVNRNLGGALRTGFQNAKGDYVIVLDLDLSYDVDHIDALMLEALKADADVVVASPYMKGGKSTKVPKTRLLLSRVVNKFMSWSAPNTDIRTFTGMVRVYKRSFLRQLNLKSNTYSINPEIILKTLILRGRIREIPAHLDWSFQEDAGGRVSSIKIFKGIAAGLMASFIFRPYAFFMVIGLLLLLTSLYMVGWIFINVADMYPIIEGTTGGYFDDRFSMAIGKVFQDRPHAFFIGGVSLLISLQFLSIGFLSLQSKRYFDELFHINTTNLRNILEARDQQSGESSAE
ncbi:MAG: glycosyltransferase family 2 protein [Bacteroidota bacterium]